jgi:D-alanine-D-alanine ligase
MLRIGLIYDLYEDYLWQPGDPADADAEFEPMATVEVLEAAIQWLGHRPVRLGGARDFLRRLDDPGIEAVLSIAEGAGTRNREAWAAVLCEMAEVPLIGSDALTLSLSLDKAATKDLAVAAGVLTPPCRVYRSAEQVDAEPTDHLPGPFPLFVKPRYEGSSKGIDPCSRVEDVNSLRQAVARVTEHYRQDALVEPFIEGPEYVVAVVGHDPPRVLPVVQRAVETSTGIGLHALQRRGRPRREWRYRLPGVLDSGQEATLAEGARRVFDKLECRDFARCDFRLDRQGRPQFLEINPLPTFAPDGTFALLAEMEGVSYPEYLAEILAGALRRLGVT